jgi:hypothetical protein
MKHKKINFGGQQQQQRKIFVVRGRGTDHKSLKLVNQLMTGQMFQRRMGGDVSGVPQRIGHQLFVVNERGVDDVQVN